MEFDVIVTGHAKGQSDHVLIECPKGIDQQEAVPETREYGVTDRCETELFAHEREAYSTTDMQVSDSETFTFVNGAGWIPDKKTAGSKVFFGFFCKQSGNYDPSGHVRFRWGDNRFQVTKFDWLAVNDDGTATFTGIGTINDKGEHDFMVHISSGPDSIDILISGQDGYDSGGLVNLGSGQIKIRQWTRWPDTSTLLLPSVRHIAKNLHT